MIWDIILLSLKLSQEIMHISWDHWFVYYSHWMRPLWGGIITISHNIHIYMCTIGWTCFSFVYTIKLNLCLYKITNHRYHRYNLAIITKPINYFGKFKFNSTKMWAIKTRDLQSRDTIKISLSFRIELHLTKRFISTHSSC